MFDFITKRSFLVNLTAVVIGGFMLIFLFMQTLNWITRHNRYLQVPDIKGKNMQEAQKLLEEQGFEVEVQDSVFF